MPHNSADPFADSELAPALADFYRTAPRKDRARLLSALLEPVGTLALVGVAAGAFARFLPARSNQQRQLCLDLVDNISAEQIQELAWYVEQKSPEVLVNVCKKEVPAIASWLPLARFDSQSTLNHQKTG